MLSVKQDRWYWRLWGAAARANGWKGAEAEMQRHAAHVKALGRDKSHSQLTNPEFDKLKALFELLADPSNLQAAIESADATIGERRRLVRGILDRVDEGYLQPILESERQYDPFVTDRGWRQWRDLPIALLRNLHMTVCNRCNSKDATSFPQNDAAECEEIVGETPEPTPVEEFDVVDQLDQSDCPF